MTSHSFCLFLNGLYSYNVVFHNILFDNNLVKWCNHSHFQQRFWFQYIASWYFKREQWVWPANRLRLLNYFAAYVVRCFFYLFLVQRCIWYISNTTQDGTQCKIDQTNQIILVFEVFYDPNRGTRTILQPRLTEDQEPVINLTTS